MKSSEIRKKYKIFHSIKYIWIYRLRNGGHFVQGGDELTNVDLSLVGSSDSPEVK